VVLALPAKNWEHGVVPLKYQLGDFVLARAALSLLRRSARLDERPLGPDEIPRPPPRLYDADGYVVWSQPITTRLPVLRIRRDAILYVPQQYRRFFVDLSGGFERYKSTFSSKTRSGLRRKLRKFAEASGGTIIWRQYRTPDQLACFFSLAKKVSAKTYQERLLGLGLPTHQAFIASAFALSEQDRVRAYLLFLGGEPIAYLYCPISERVVSYDRLGYDPTYASLSPGTILQMLALEALFSEQQFSTFDFTEGEGQHKEMFSTGYCLCGDVFVLNRRPMPVSLVALHYVVDRASSSIGRTLERLRVKSQLRRLYRNI